MLVAPQALCCTLHRPRGQGLASHLCKVSSVQPHPRQVPGRLLRFWLVHGTASFLLFPLLLLLQHLLPHPLDGICGGLHGPGGQGLPPQRDHLSGGRHRAFVGVVHLELYPLSRFFPCSLLCLLPLSDGLPYNRLGKKQVLCGQIVFPNEWHTLTSLSAHRNASSNGLLGCGSHN